MDTKALVKLIEILDPLTSEERLRNINAALTALGDPSLSTSAQPVNPSPPAPDAAPVGGGAQYAADFNTRLRQNNIPAAHVEQVFEFHDDGSFSLIRVPGKGAKDRTLNVYALVGLGTFLSTGKRDFTDDAAREACKVYGCYDLGNHSKTMKAHPASYIAKGSDWMLTVPGIKDAAALLKEVADEAAKP